MNSIIFGPVISRRFGTSLGIDLSPNKKQCNFDCLYCELEPKHPQNKYDDVVSVDEIIDEVKKHLTSDIDVLTITANGEPTLYPYLDELIDEINKIKKDTKTLILTNATGLLDEQVFYSLLKLDKVKLSFDAVTPEIFKKIDRPVKDINTDELIEKMVEFSYIYSSELYVEVLFVKGLNDSIDEVKKLNEVLKEFKNLTRVDLSSIDRPPAYAVESLSYHEIYELSNYFDNDLPIFIASRKEKEVKKFDFSENEILNTLDKRPLTLEDIKHLFSDDSLEIFYSLANNGEIIKKTVNDIEFYLPSGNENRKRK